MNPALWNPKQLDIKFITKSYGQLVYFGASEGFVNIKIIDVIKQTYIPVDVRLNTLIEIFAYLRWRFSFYRDYIIDYISYRKTSFIEQSNVLFSVEQQGS